MSNKRKAMRKKKKTYWLLYKTWNLFIVTADLLVFI